jgi:hypothetical protein
MAQQTDNPVDENGYPVYGTFRQPTKQQTAVEWLWRWQMDNEFASFSEAKNAYKQAKEMEKQQISEGYRQGVEEDVYNNPLKTGDEYYNETYNK